LHEVIAGAGLDGSVGKRDGHHIERQMVCGSKTD